MQTKAQLTMVWLFLVPLWISQPAMAQSEGVPPDGPITLFETRIALSNGSAIDHAVLGDLYLRRARLTGDLGDLVAAERVARQALILLPGSPLGESILLRVLSEQHSFADARDLAVGRLERDRSDSALTTLADALFEPGRGMSRALLKLSGSLVHDYATISDDSPSPNRASRARRAATSAGIS